MSCAQQCRIVLYSSLVCCGGAVRLKTFFFFCVYKISGVINLYIYLYNILFYCTILWIKKNHLPLYVIAFGHGYLSFMFNISFFLSSIKVNNALYIMTDSILLSEEMNSWHVGPNSVSYKGNDISLRGALNVMLLEMLFDNLGYVWCAVLKL